MFISGRGPMNQTVPDMASGSTLGVSKANSQRRDEVICRGAGCCDRKQVRGVEMAGKKWSPERSAEQRIQKALKTGATKLDLVRLKLTALPESLGQLTQLQALDVADNQ